MMWWLTCTAIGGLIALTDVRNADNLTGKRAPAGAASIGEQLPALATQFANQRQTILEQYRQAQTSDDKQDCLHRYHTLGYLYAREMVQLAESNRGKEVAVQALVFILLNADTTPEAAVAAERLVQHHLDDRAMLNLPQRLAHSPSPACAFLLKELAERTKVRALRGEAALALGQALKVPADLVRQNRGATPMLRAWLERRMGATFVERLRKVDPEDLEKDADKYLTVALRQYSELNYLTHTIGKQAVAELYELHQLRIGKSVPQIAGHDIEGKHFSLSEVKGQVVLLDFWGHW
jgi:hypothetical protein